MAEDPHNHAKQKQMLPLATALGQQPLQPLLLHWAPHSVAQEAEARALEAQQQLQALQQRQDALLASAVCVPGLKERVAGLEAQLRQMGSDLEAAQEQVEAAERRAADLEVQLQQAGSDLEVARQLAQAGQAAEARAARLQAEVEQLEAELKAAMLLAQRGAPGRGGDDEAGGVGGGGGGGSGSSEGEQGRPGAEEGRMQDLGMRLDQLQAELKEALSHAQRAQAAETRAAELEEEVGQLQAGLKDALQQGQQCAAGAEARAAELEAHVVRLQAELADAGAAAGTADARVVELEVRLQQLQAELVRAAAAEQEAGRMGQRVAELDQHVVWLRGELEAAAAAALRQEREKQEWEQGEMGALRQALARREAEAGAGAAALSARVAELEACLRSAQASPVKAGLQEGEGASEHAAGLHDAQGRPGGTGAIPEVEGVRQEWEQLASRILKLRAALRTSQQEATAAQQELAECRGEMHAYQQACDEAVRARLQEQARAHDALQQQVGGCTGPVEEELCSAGAAPVLAQAAGEELGGLLRALAPHCRGEQRVAQCVCAALPQRAEGCSVRLCRTAAESRGLLSAFVPHCRRERAGSPCPASLFWYFLSMRGQG